MGRRPVRGSITAYVSLLIVLLISFVGGIADSASIQAGKHEHYAKTQLAASSLFAEYDRDLLEQFDVFAIDASYGDGSLSKEQILERLIYYGAGDHERTIQRLELLTDHNGREFYRQVVAYMEEQYGVSGLPGIDAEAGKWESDLEEADRFSEVGKKEEEALEALLSENEVSLPEEDNPLPNVKRLQREGLLRAVFPKGKSISAKAVKASALPTGRSLTRGYGSFADVKQEENIAAKPLYVEYVLSHFTDVTSEEEKGGALEYELEYLVGGKESDMENLKHVVGKLLAIRFLPNYMYLQSDNAKKAEAEALALTLCSVLAVPAITEAVKQLLLFSWALGESVMDLRSLLSGGNVPLAKTSDAWQLSLSSLLTLGTAEDHGEGMDVEGGMSYRDYLRILLHLEAKEHLTMRTLDLIELRIKTRKGRSKFRLDSCVTKMEVMSICKLRRGIQYEFPVYFGYR